MSKKVTSWTDKDVIEWLKRENINTDAQNACTEHNIDGTCILSLLERDFYEHPLDKLRFSTKKKFYVAVKALQRENRPAMIDLGLCEGYLLHSTAANINYVGTNLSHLGSVSKSSENSSNDHNQYYETETISRLGSEDGRASRLKPEIWKTFLSLCYVFLVTWVTAVVMVIVHDKVPDMKKYPPLPDLFLDNVPHIPWAFDMCEITGSVLMAAWITVLLFHKHRFILLRRFFALAGTVFLLRCITMLITSLSVPGSHLKCEPRTYPPADGYADWGRRLLQAYDIWIHAGFILLRRFFALAGTVFLLRCITMLITSLSVPGSHLKCEPRTYPPADGYADWGRRLLQAYDIWSGAGMSVRGVRTCGDYMFSGHTVALTLLNFFITEYTSRSLYLLHIVTWLMNMFGIFFILAAHEHYSIDVFIAFYITSRLFLYYHTLSNNQALMQGDSMRTRIWFPLLSYFESEVDGIVPNEYEGPLELLTNLKNWIWQMCKDITESSVAQIAGTKISQGAAMGEYSVVRFVDGIKRNLSVADGLSKRQPALDKDVQASPCSEHEFTCKESKPCERYDNDSCLTNQHTNSSENVPEVTREKNHCINKKCV